MLKSLERCKNRTPDGSGALISGKLFRLTAFDRTVKAIDKKLLTDEISEFSYFG
jgi:hypothetical protein